MNNKVSEKNIEDAFEEFMKFNKAKRLAQSSMEYYERKIGRFICHVKIKNTCNLDEKNIIDYKIYLQEVLDNSTSINTHLKAIRTFLYYCMRLDYMDSFKVKLITEENKIKETYSDKELKNLLEKPKLKEVSFAEYRNWVIINWILSTGNRARTIRSVKIKDIDFESGYITINKTKNKNQQLIPLGSILREILSEYLAYRKGDREDWLFPSIYNNKLTASSFYSAIRKYNLKRGVNKTSIHLFRHTFAKKWILNGGDMFRLQKLLGHKSLDMVKEYVSMFSEDLKEDFEQYNPLNEFNECKKTIKMND